MIRKTPIYFFHFVTFLLSVISVGEGYQGPLKCKGLQEKLAYFPPLPVGRFCAAAINNCDALAKMKALKSDNPLRQEMEEEFNRRFKLDMEVCELAILSYDPGYHENTLKRGDSLPGESGEIPVTEEVEANEQDIQ